jgi:hypothetical protein
MPHIAIYVESSGFGPDAHGPHCTSRLSPGLDAFCWWRRPDRLFHHLQCHRFGPLDPGWQRQACPRQSGRWRDPQALCLRSTRFTCAAGSRRRDGATIRFCSLCCSRHDTSGSRVSTIRPDGRTRAALADAAGLIGPKRAKLTARSHFTFSDSSHVTHDGHDARPR